MLKTSRLNLPKRVFIVYRLLIKNVESFGDHNLFEQKFLIYLAISGIEKNVSKSYIQYVYLLGCKHHRFSGAPLFGLRKDRDCSVEKLTPETFTYLLCLLFLLQ